MSKILIKSAMLINEGKRQNADVLIENGRIVRIDTDISDAQAQVISAENKWLIPGVIDDQVHFREPGLTHKAEIQTEARAAVAGGTTTFMEMPNTQPQTLTQELLEQKYQRAAACSIANYSFFMGVSNENLEEVLKTNPKNVCGLKIFMGSSTGDMLVDQVAVLEKIFAETDLLIATHCEDEQTVRANEALYKHVYGEHIPFAYHPHIRDEAACLRSSSLAIDLAKKHNTRLHILHISTQDELALFSNKLPLEQKRITAEVCVHHLWFTADDYAQKGSLIKCNPAIKAPHHRPKLWEALLDDRLDIIATDHAPHTMREKSNPYTTAPSGLPLVQHALLMMIEAHKKGWITMEKVIEKMCHAPATCFQIKERGFIREGYWADLVLIDPEAKTTVSKNNLHYKCGWSPLEGETFGAKVTHTFVSGHLAYHEGKFFDNQKGQRITFER
ncbi:MAG: dihydroorotase [Bernardetiaceae bacterium]|nr:dihydroorotase [Bernardetiaceae bacterium]